MKTSNRSALYDLSTSFERLAKKRHRRAASNSPIEGPRAGGGAGGAAQFKADRALDAQQAEEPKRTGGAVEEQDQDGLRQGNQGQGGWERGRERAAPEAGCPVHSGFREEPVGTPAGTWEGQAADVLAGKKKKRKQKGGGTASPGSPASGDPLVGSLRDRGEVGAGPPGDSGEKRGSMNEDALSAEDPRTSIAGKAAEKGRKRKGGGSPREPGAQDDEMPQAEGEAGRLPSSSEAGPSGETGDLLKKRRKKKKKYGAGLSEPALDAGSPRSHGQGTQTGPSASGDPGTVVPKGPKASLNQGPTFGLANGVATTASPFTPHGKSPGALAGTHAPGQGSRAVHDRRDGGGGTPKNALLVSNGHAQARDSVKSGPSQVVSEETAGKKLKKKKKKRSLAGGEGTEQLGDGVHVGSAASARGGLLPPPASAVFC